MHLRIDLIQYAYPDLGGIVRRKEMHSTKTEVHEQLPGVTLVRGVVNTCCDQ